MNAEDEPGPRPRPSPLVFHIGFHKTASSWLQSVFIPDAGNNIRTIGGRFEPRRDMVWPRAFEYDAAAVRAKYQPQLQTAASNNEVPIISDERFSGNPISGGYDTKEIADRISETFPDCRILIVIREQRSMLYSTYDQYVRRGGGSSIGNFLFPNARYVVPPFRFEHFMYDKLIGYYMSLFSAEKVRVLPFELFRKQPESFLDQMLEFCGATCTSMPDTARRVNKGRAASIIPIERRLNYFLVRDDVNGQSPLAIPRADYYLKPLVAKLRLPAFIDRKIKAAIEKEVSAACQGRFQASNKRTETLTGLDLRQYGYDC